jgi:hypothetical protein
MSQQQFYESEIPQEHQHAYAASVSEEDFGYRARREEPGQKVYPHMSMSAAPSAQHSSISAGQRLALAIVSVSVLVPIVAILIEGGISDTDSGNLFILSGRLIALALVCLTIMIVNLAFNRHR